MTGRLLVTYFHEYAALRQTPPSDNFF